MKCCTNCFKDAELISNIKSLSCEIEDCDYCQGKTFPCIDVEDLMEMFIPLVNLYIPDDNSTVSLPEIIQQDWDIFNCNTETTSKILLDMFASGKETYAQLFKKTVSNKETSVGASLLLNQWISLKKEIIYNNRFLNNNIIDFDLLEELFVDQTHHYYASNNIVFFRGRISKENGIEITEMGKPPVDKTTAGRANPVGIPYLYLSTNEKTTLYETRSTYLDYVTIGTFQLKENLKIVRLRAIREKSPFVIQNLEKYIQYQPFLMELEKELSKPLRRYDSDLDYLPTQYLCEFIKSRGYDGVEFGSAMNKSGVNLAIFNDFKFECVSTKVVEIKNIEITY